MASEVAWPAKKSLSNLKAAFPQDFQQFENVSSDSKYYKKNLLKIKITQESLDYKLLKEYAKYPVSYSLFYFFLKAVLAKNVTQGKEMFINY